MTPVMTVRHWLRLAHPRPLLTVRHQEDLVLALKDLQKEHLSGTMKCGTMKCGSKNSAPSYRYDHDSTRCRRTTSLQMSLATP